MFNNLTPLAQLRPAASLLPLPRQEPKPVYDGHYRLPSVIPIAPENCSRPPEEQRAAFMKSRSDGLKYKDIAKDGGVSVKTIEYRISQALRHLRVALADFFNS